MKKRGKPTVHEIEVGATTLNHPGVLVRFTEAEDGWLVHFIDQYRGRESEPGVSRSVRWKAVPMTTITTAQDLADVIHCEDNTMLGTAKGNAVFELLGYDYDQVNWDHLW